MPHLKPLVQHPKSKAVIASQLVINTEFNENKESQADRRHGTRDRGIKTLSVTLFGTTVGEPLKRGNFGVLRIDLKCLSHIGFHLQTLSPVKMDLGQVDVRIR